MPSREQVESQFRVLNQDLVQSYEMELKDLRQQYERGIKSRQVREQRTREIMRTAKIDVDALDRLEREQEDALPDYLRTVRPNMVNRDVPRVADAKEHALRMDQLPPGHRVSSVYASTLLAPDAGNLEGNPGEKGNPWILPYNPGEVNIRQRSSGSGWGCWAEGIPAPASALFWFNFTPDQLAAWTFWAFVDLEGFYIVRADDSWYNCKSAEISLEVVVDVHQYYWHGQKRFSLLKVSGDNIDRTGFYGQAPRLDYVTWLKPGDLTWVYVRVFVHAFADGSGSYAELNFADGTANFIKPLVVIALH